jgi:hypothetical protein
MKRTGRVILGRTWAEEDKSAQDWFTLKRGLVWASIVLLCIVFWVLLFRGCAYSATLDEWANAIKITEGKNAHYGIKSVKFKNDQEARAICKSTVLHAWRDWVAKKGNSSDLKGYIDFLADRYCPKSADLKGNINWKHNMYILMGA